jgi:lipoate-protein ligase A
MLSPYELTAGGRKLVGLAQVRRRNGVLMQSAIHRHFDADRLAALLDMTDTLPEALRRSAIGLDELMDVTGSQIIDAVEKSLEDRLHVSLVDGGWSTTEQLHIDAPPR